MKSDRELRIDVGAELKWDPSVDASRIRVEAQAGIVTLAGLVNSHAQKCSAQAAAWRVCGVEGVITGLEVVLPDVGRRTDKDIAKAARNVLAWNALIPPQRVKVAVQDSRVLLSGRVEWEYQSRAAESLMRDLVGIRGLVNLIEIRPAIEPRDVTRQIKSAFRRRSFRGAGDVSVVVNGGTVTLYGHLESWSERDAARSIAWRARGVRNVVDQITIAA